MPCAFLIISLHSSNEGAVGTHFDSMVLFVSESVGGHLSSLMATATTKDSK